MLLITSQKKCQTCELCVAIQLQPGGLPPLHPCHHFILLTQDIKTGIIFFYIKNLHLHLHLPADIAHWVKGNLAGCGLGGIQKDSASSIANECLVLLEVFLSLQNMDIVRGLVTDRLLVDVPGEVCRREGHLLIKISIERNCPVQKENFRNLKTWSIFVLKL